MERERQRQRERKRGTHTEIEREFSFSFSWFLKVLVNRVAVAQSVQHATPGEEVIGSIPAEATRTLFVESVSV